MHLPIETARNGEANVKFIKWPIVGTIRDACLRRKPIWRDCPDERMAGSIDGYRESGLMIGREAAAAPTASAWRAPAVPAAMKRIRAAIDGADRQGNGQSRRIRAVAVILQRFECIAEQIIARSINGDCVRLLNPFGGYCLDSNPID